MQDAGFPVGIQADELNWVDTFGFREQVFIYQLAPHPGHIPHIYSSNEFIKLMLLFCVQAEGEDGNQLVFITNHLNVWFDQPNSANPDVFGTPASSVSMRIVSFPIGNVESYMQVGIWLCFCNLLVICGRGRFTCLPMTIQCPVVFCVVSRRRRRARLPHRCVCCDSSNAYIVNML